MMTSPTSEQTAAGHVTRNTAVAVTFAPRYPSDQYPWTTARGTRFANHEVTHTTGPRPTTPKAPRIKGGETVRYQGSLIEHHGTTWTAWAQPGFPGRLQLRSADGKVMCNVRPASVVVI
ncbi:hypothetical protein C8D87_114122 [Lentzea atacamensis]|uniref:Uncharacterized protein n=1 Tax=Lentzea atacamensis TaxID=531938 RepID=A0ABX9DZ59_9PSEU|nr:hypothetical protein [Lentzea atacamensis]RAS59510.1 hypothetical protein C8D87_114122 [Lentzea atacamensis]